MANTQPNRSYENVRSVKSNVVNVAREMQQATNKIKQQANSLTEAIRAKKAELKAALQPAAQQEVVAPVVEEAVAVQPVVDQPVQVCEPASTSTEAVATPNEPQAEAQTTQQTTVKEAAPAEAPAVTKVVSVTENGREVKTYTDEKGNVKVRRFLDTSTRRPPVV
ncbi:MAG: hypothetical protein IJ032_06590, partial [Clostridia bacterium]|nr:hypothetical protein [Clostridia bacterium]